MIATSVQKRKRTRSKIPQLFRVLLLETDVKEGKTLLPFAEQIALDRKGRLIILSVLIVPEGEQMSVVAKKASRLREELTTYLEDTTISTRIKTLVRTEEDIWDGIHKFILRERIDFILAHWSVSLFDKDFQKNIPNNKLFELPCDIAVVRPAIPITESENWHSVKRILLPVRGGVNAALSLRVGHALASLENASITLLHVTPSENREEKPRFIEEFSPAISELKHITRSITTKGDIVQSIVAEAEDHQVITIGAPSSEIQPKSWMTPLLDTILSDETKTIAIVNEYIPQEISQIATRPTIKPRERPLAVVVDKWFAENTYHSREFTNLERLVQLKEDQGVSISLALPALNEQETVGNVIQTVKSALFDQVPLLDEMVLIDSGSSDQTREIAAELGVPVYIHQEILPHLSAYTGKGEALWKSLYVVSGDIIAWIDTDIKNIDPQFVYGILGPLLTNPNIRYVKGFYRRPIRQGNKMVAGGGGRVTELAVRPFINLFFPELSGLIQPLSGEYAGRRQALERLPFFTGYGVETGLLIDILDRFGLEAIAQVDLLERIHHNQPLPSLSKMSFAIMQVVFNRLENQNDVHLLEEANLMMNLIRFSKRRGYFLEQEEIHEYERPAMISIRDYRLKRNIASPEGY
jgi:glycosyltransferase involved in cell wall biosynthesis/nucleotide-binding universal stress UspA family protein